MAERRDPEESGTGAAASPTSDAQTAGSVSAAPRHRADDRTLDHAEYLRRGRIPALDGIRAVSILLVVTAHIGNFPGWSRLHGGTGVSIFFVLSGYLITTLALREEKKYGNVDLVAFYIRRLFRIYPVFFLVLGFYVVLIMGLGMQPERRDAFVSNIPWYVFGVPEHATFFNNYSVPVPFDGAWSIGIEEKFYLVWPFLGFVVLVASRRRWRLPVVCAVFVLAVGMNWWGTSWGNALAPYGLIAIGVAGALLLDNPTTYSLVRVLGRPLPLLGLLTVFLVAQFGTRLTSPGQALYVLYGLVLTPLLIGIIVTRTRFLRILEARPLVALGVWSYVLYLIHNFGLNTAEMLIPNPSNSFLGSVLTTAVGLGSSLIAAALIHRLFEAPLHHWGQRIARGHRAAKAPSR